MEPTQTLRGAVVGCGFFAQNHLHGWQEVNGAEIIAVCDLDPDKTHRAQATFNSIKSVYTDIQKMFALEQLDFVDIVTTMDSHRALVESAAQAGVPVIVQKPFAPTMTDAEAMVAACKAANVPLMVHENFRWQTPMIKIGELIHSGAIGKPFFSRISFRHGNPVGYENQPYLFEQDEYIINDVGIHLFDLARFYMGEVASLFTQSQQVNRRFKGEDVATIMLRHANNATSICDLSVSTHGSPDPFPQTLVTVEGTQGTLKLLQDFRLLVERGVTGSNMVDTLDVSPTVYEWAEQPWAIVQESVVNIQQHWCDCLRAQRTPATSGEDNLKSLELTFLAYESAKTGNVVIVD